MKYAAFNEIHSHEISFEGFGTCIHQSAVSRFDKIRRGAVMRASTEPDYKSSKNRITNVFFCPKKKYLHILLVIFQGIYELRSE